MSVTLFPLARMTVASSGTGNITLNAAVTGFLTFDLSGCSTASTGQLVTYAIGDTTQSEIATGTYYSSSLLLVRGSSTNGLKSTNSDSPIDMSNAAQVFITPSAPDLNDVWGQCYLSYSAGNLVLSPKYGNRLTINSNTQTVPSAGVTLTSTTVTSSACYYIYAYMNSSAMTLERSTTAYTIQSVTGIPIKTGDATRTFVGLWYASGSSVWGSAQTHGASYFNPQERITTLGTFSPTANSTTFAERPAGGAFRITGVTIAGRNTKIRMNGYGSIDTAGNSANYNIVRDGSTSATMLSTDMYLLFNLNQASFVADVTAVGADIEPAEGAHYYSYYANINNVGVVFSTVMQLYVETWG